MTTHLSIPYDSPVPITKVIPLSATDFLPVLRPWPQPLLTHSHQHLNNHTLQHQSPPLSLPFVCDEAHLVEPIDFPQLLHRCLLGLDRPDVGRPLVRVRFVPPHCAAGGSARAGPLGGGGRPRTASCEALPLPPLLLLREKTDTISFPSPNHGRYRPKDR